MAKAAKPKTPTKTPDKAPDKNAASSAAAAPKKLVTLGDDPSLDALTAGLSALQAKDWKKAVGLFEQAVETSDRPEVKDKARQFLHVSRQKVGAGEGKPAQEAADADPFLLAVYEKNRGNLAGALEMSRKGGRDQKDERFAYLTASIHAAEDRLDEAVQALTKAIELNPKNRIHAFHDPDFAELRKNRDQQRALFGL